MTSREALEKLSTVSRQGLFSPWPPSGFGVQFNKLIKPLGEVFDLLDESPDPQDRDKILGLFQEFLRTQEVPAELKQVKAIRHLAWLINQEVLFSEESVLRTAVLLITSTPDPFVVLPLTLYCFNKPIEARKSGLLGEVWKLIELYSKTSVSVAKLRPVFHRYLQNQSLPVTAKENSDFQQWILLEELPSVLESTLLVEATWLRIMASKQPLSLDSCRKLILQTNSFALGAAPSIARAIAVTRTIGQAGHDDLCQKALVEIGDPTLLPLWEFCRGTVLDQLQPYIESCRQYLKVYAIKAVLEYFFRRMTSYAGDSSRLDFWSRYASRIDSIHVLSSRGLRQSLLNGLGQNEVFLAQFVRDHFHTVEDNGSAAALLMRFDDTLIAEFTEANNATFVYHRNGYFGRQFDHFPPTNIGYLRKLKNMGQHVGSPGGANKEGRLIHRYGWQSDFTSLLRYTLGILP